MLVRRDPLIWARVALVARAGQHLSRYRVRYSHIAIAIRDYPAGRWTVVHALNDCGTAASVLYNEAQLVMPGEGVQDRLAALLATRTPLRLHEPKYNMLAYVFQTRYRNSNGWVRETLGAAAAPAGQEHRHPRLRRPIQFVRV